MEQKENLQKTQLTKYILIIAVTVQTLANFCRMWTFVLSWNKTANSGNCVRKAEQQWDKRNRV